MQMQPMHLAPLNKQKHYQHQLQQQTQNANCRNARQCIKFPLRCADVWSPLVAAELRQQQQPHTSKIHYGTYLNALNYTLSKYLKSRPAHGRNLSA